MTAESEAVSEVKRISTGSSVLDKLLEGGYETDVVTAIYGPAGSGKTTTCLLAAISTVLNKEDKNKKVIFVDTEGGFSTDRLRQLTSEYKKVLDKIFLLKPISFAEQKKCAETIAAYPTPKIGIIVFDTISSLYRIERGEDNISLNRELGKQLAALIAIARSEKIPTIITTPVYADFDDKTKVKVVGGDIIKYSSKCLIELQSLHRNMRKAVLRKHRSLPEKEVMFRIVEQGFEEA